LCSTKRFSENSLNRPQDIADIDALEEIEQMEHEDE
jgi:hypothetical protein